MQINSGSCSRIENPKSASADISFKNEMVLGPIIPSTTRSSEARPDTNAGISECASFFAPLNEASGSETSMRNVALCRTQDTGTNVDNPEQTVEDLQLEIGWYFFVHN